MKAQLSFIDGSGAADQRGSQALDLAAMSQTLKGMANEHRLSILAHLEQGESTVTELQTRVGISQSLASQHLARLRQHDLVTSRRSKNCIYYALKKDGVVELIRSLHRMTRRLGQTID